MRLLFWLAGSLSLASLSQAQARVASPISSHVTCHAGQVLEVQGDVNYESAAQSRVAALHVGSCVEDGMSVFTRQRSTARFRLASDSFLNGASVGMAPSTEVLVGFPLGGRPTKMVLTRGEIRFASEVSVPSGLGGESPILNVLGVAVTVREKGTVVLAEVFREGQEAWVITLHGSARLKLGNQASVVELKAGQSTYFSDEQKTLPTAVPLTDDEINNFDRDRKFKHTLSQVLMIESGAEPANQEPQDLTLDQYARQEAAKKAPKLPAPPTVSTLPSVTLIAPPTQRPASMSTSPMATQNVTSALNSAPIARPGYSNQTTRVFVGPVQPKIISTTTATATVTTTVVSPGASTVVRESAFENTDSQNQSLDSSRLKNASNGASAQSNGATFRGDLAASFFSDAVGPDLSFSYLSAPLAMHDGTHQWVWGAGAGFEHASKDSVDVTGVKFFGLGQIPFQLNSTLSLKPEIQLGLGFEKLSNSTQTYANGLAFFYGARLNFEMNVERATSLHPGVFAGFQEFVGGSGALSAIVGISLRFE